jgi:hypothetical protein
MRIFKYRFFLEKAINVLIGINIVAIIFAFFSPSLPRLKISLFHLKEELVCALLLLLIFFAVLKKDKLLFFVKNKDFKNGIFIFFSIFSLQILTRIPFLLNDKALLNSDKSVTLLMIKNISKGISFPIYFYGQFYQGSLNAYVYSLIYALIPSLKTSVLVGNLIFFSLFILLSSLLINKITDSSSFFYPILILSLPLTGLLFFSNDEVRGIPFIVFFEILLIYFVFKVIFEKKEHFTLIGLTVGILFWIYQPSVTTVIVILSWMFLSLIHQHRFEVFIKSLLFIIVGFLFGSLPHILGELNSSFINTKVLFFSRSILNSLTHFNKTSFSNIAAATVMELDVNKIISYVFAFLFAFGLVISISIAIRKKDTKRLYLPLLFSFNLILLLFSRYPPIQRYIVHYRLYSFFTVLIVVLVFKELKIFDIKIIKVLFLLFFVSFSLWRTAGQYPFLRKNHLENERDIAEINRIEDRIILGKYWDTMRIAPFLDDRKVITVTPSSRFPDAIFGLSKYYPTALRLGGLWDNENKSFIAPFTKKRVIDELLKDFNIKFLTKKLPSGRYIIYSNFSQELSPSIYELLNSDLKRRYILGKKPVYFYFKDKITSLPELIVEGKKITILIQNGENFSLKSLGKKFFRDWRLVLKRGKMQISFPIDFSKKRESYVLPESVVLEKGKYEAYITFLNMPVFYHDEVRLEEIYKNKKLIISDLRDPLSFVAFQDRKNEYKNGLPINQTRIRVLDKAITSIELHIYSFFNFNSSIWTNRFQQMLMINEEEFPLNHRENKIVYPLTDKKELGLNVKYKTLLCAKDTKGNPIFYNTGAVLEKIVIHSKDLSWSVVPFLKKVK